MKLILRAVREDWPGALGMAILAVCLCLYMFHNARKSDLMMRAYLECPPQYSAIYTQHTASGIQCVGPQYLVLRGMKAMNAVKAEPRYAELDIEVVTMTAKALKIDAGLDEAVWIPFSAIEDEESARELQIGDLAEIRVEENLAADKGLI